MLRCFDRRSREPGRPDFVTKRGRLWRRLHAQLGTQRLAAALVLREGRTSLAIMPERAHQLLVRFLTPWVQLELAPRHTLDVVEGPAALVIVRQAREDAKRLLMQRFPLERGPLLECRAVAQEELIEQRTTVERRRLFEPLGTVGAQSWLPVRMLCARGD